MSTFLDRHTWEFNKLWRLPQRKRHIKIDFCVRLIVLPLIHVDHVVPKKRCDFRCLGMDEFHEEAENESFTSADSVVVRT